MAHRELQMDDGKMENGKWRMAYREWQMENSKWRIADGEWQIENGT